MARIIPRRPPLGMGLPTISGEGEVNAGAGSGITPEPALAPLAIILPLTAGQATPDIAGAPVFPSGHFALFACQGDVYEFWACAKDGSWPHVWRIVSGAPAGYEISADGHVTWTVPTGLSNGQTYTITLACVDGEETERQCTYTLTVDSTKFKFFSGSGDDVTGTGSRTAPWRSITKLRSSMIAGQIAKFYNGTYGPGSLGANNVVLGSVNTTFFAATTNTYEIDAPSSPAGLSLLYETGPNVGFGQLCTAATNVGTNRWRITNVHANLPQVPTHGDTFGFGNTWQRIEWRSDIHCTQWMAVFGQAPVLDHGFTGPRASWGWLYRYTRIGNNPCVVRGFQHINLLDKAIQTIAGGDYYLFEDLTASEETFNARIDGSNPAIVLNVASGSTPVSTLSIFRRIVCNGTTHGALKLYNQNQIVIEGCHGLFGEGSWDVKRDVQNYDIRATQMIGNASNIQSGWFGNVAGTCNGVTRYCLYDVRDADGADPLACDIGQGGPITQLGPCTWVRCTFRGRVLARNLLTSYGDITFLHCVIENEDDEFPNRVFTSNNEANTLFVTECLDAAEGDAILDVNGKLIGTARDNHGPLSAEPYGWEWDESTAL